MNAGESRPLEALDRPADRATIHSLHAAGLLNAEARDEALRWLQPPRDWWGWSSRGLLYLGTALLLSGVVFFFAFNWAEMADFVKFGILEGAILATAVAAAIVGIDRLGGKILTLASGLLVGVLLAVYGQVYQTGADPYELFAGWAALIFGWVVVARFPALWLMWLVLVHLALILYWDQAVGRQGWISEGFIFVVLSLVNSIVLIGRERVASKERWFRWTVWFGALAFSAWPLFLFIVGEMDGLAGVTAGLVLAGMLALGYRHFRRRSPDLTALTLGGMALSAVVLSAIGRGLFEIADGAGIFLLFGLCIIGVVGAMVLGLWQLGRAMRSEAHA